MKQVLRYILIASIVLCYSAVVINAQIVTNLSFEQIEEADVRITYETNKVSDVSISVSLD